MTSIRLTKFSGMMPAVDDRLLPDQNASYAQGVHFGEGTLRGFRPTASVFSMVGPSNLKVFRFPNDPTLPGTVNDFSNSVWMEFNTRDVDVLRSPVTDDSYQRLYWASAATGARYNTGAGVRAGSQSYKLGIPRPQSPPGVSPTGGVSTTIVARAYLYTYVSTFGEEGPPSPPTVANGPADAVWGITIPSIPGSALTDRSLGSIRLYRTVTGNSGVATYYLITEFGGTGAQTLNDTFPDTYVASNSAIPSIGWNPPPDFMKGMVQMPNGVIAGWSGESDIWFCEPYRPHAWPPQYNVTVDSPVVGLGVTGNSLVVATRGAPSVISGTHPAQMAQINLGVPESCTSRQSIISTPQGVYYSSPNGIVLAGPGGVQNLTDPLITREEWVAYCDPYNIRAARHGTSYVAVPVGAGSSGTGFLIDAGDTGFEWLDLGTNVANLVTDFWSGETFIIQGGVVKHFNPAVVTAMNPYTWTSKKFVSPQPVNFSTAKILFSLPNGAPALNPVPNTNLIQTLAADQWGLFRVYADDSLVFCRELRVAGGAGEMFNNLPGGFKATLWQFEIEARVYVHSIEIATSPRELSRV